jgi:hypothetical protein
VVVEAVFAGVDVCFQAVLVGVFVFFGELRN